MSFATDLLSTSVSSSASLDTKSDLVDDQPVLVGATSPPLDHGASSFVRINVPVTEWLLQNKIDVRGPMRTCQQSASNVSLNGSNLSSSLGDLISSSNGGWFFGSASSDAPPWYNCLPGVSSLPREARPPSSRRRLQRSLAELSSPRRPWSRRHLLSLRFHWNLMFGPTWPLVLEGLAQGCARLLRRRRVIVIVQTCIVIVHAQPQA